MKVRDLIVELLAHDPEAEVITPADMGREYYCLAAGSVCTSGRRPGRLYKEADASQLSFAEVEWPTSSVIIDQVMVGE